ncbi:hypothetical protein BDB00DRAFT_501058 [Zychaea mexicana]|uniref:uncharacterized protein n=1 Tax=Zychaea mexicana TaxID=64656 RepID=UPI0022FE9ED0|nr:uncharacterized protein BDB00DRAFT_501058 [Zychaea mexicana]KAI9498156.1 hypothetical protein BDB00DRAFT_501058 [Zychaea mexicana]
MGYFTKDEWMKGMGEHRINTVEELKHMLPLWDQSIKDDAVFKKLYLFTFAFAKTTGQKSMDVDVAMALWPIMLSPAKYPHIPSFVEFLRSEKPVRVINKGVYNVILQ